MNLIANVVLNTQKNPFFTQATQKHTCQSILTKKILEWKISNPKKSFTHRHHFKSEVPTCPWGNLCPLFLVINIDFVPPVDGVLRKSSSEIKMPYIPAHPISAEDAEQFLRLDFK